METYNSQLLRIDQLPIRYFDINVKSGLNASITLRNDPFVFSTDENFLAGLWGKSYKGSCLAHYCYDAEDIWKYVFVSFKDFIERGTENRIAISYQQLWALDVPDVGLFYENDNKQHYKNFSNLITDLSAIQFEEVGSAFVVHKFGNGFDKNTGFVIYQNNGLYGANVVTPPIVGRTRNDKFIYDIGNVRSFLGYPSICVVGRPLLFKQDELAFAYEQLFELNLANSIDKGYISNDFTSF